MSTLDSMTPGTWAKKLMELLEEQQFPKDAETMK